MLQAKHFQILEGTEVMRKIQGNDCRETTVLSLLQQQNDDTWEEDGIVYHKGHIYVPPDPDLCRTILHENHDPTDVRHPRQYWMTELVKWTYWWPAMCTNIKKYVKGCDSCQRIKVHTKRMGTPLHPLPIPQAPWKEISIDLIGPLPLFDEKDAILVIIDCFSKMIQCVTTRTDLTSHQLAKIYRNEI